jgi:replicative DNA helicase
MAVLGSCIVSKEALWDAILSGLGPSDFYGQQNRVVWTALQDIGENGSGEADEAAVIHWLRTSGMLDVVGGVTTISGLTSAMPAPSLVKHHIESLKAMRVARDLDRLCSNVIAMDSPAAKINAIEAGVIKILGSVADAETSTMSEIAKKHSLLVPREFLTSGLAGLDDRVRLRPGTMMVLAATPGSGKTSLALQIALNAATAGSPVLFASAEMAGRELLERAVAQECGVGPGIVRNPRGNYIDLISSCQESMKSLDALHVMEPGAMSPPKIGAMAKMTMVRGGLDLIVADYLQLMGLKGAKGFTREQVVGEIARQLKVISQELNVPMIVCSQLNRRHKNEKRPPEMWDLRESGAIEAHADSVVMLDRPENEETTMVYIRKDRFGVPDRMRLRFVNGGRFKEYGTQSNV